jgi:alpha-tubulin suppressor-like RCC1 family protein
VIAKAVATGDDFSLALGTNGTVYSWGSDSKGQLGYPSAAGDINPTPTAIVGPAAFVNVKAIAAGGAFSLARTSSKVWAWGQGSSGQLGRGVFPDHKGHPRKVLFTSACKGLKPSAIAAGYDHAMVRAKTGEVCTWGDNNYGQLGDNQAELQSAVPVLAIGINAKAIAAGAFHSLALDATKAVWAWGDNTWGQQGNTTYAPPFNDVPVPVPAAPPWPGTATLLGTGAASDHVVVS